MPPASIFRLPAALHHACVIVLAALAIAIAPVITPAQAAAPGAAAMSWTSCAGPLNLDPTSSPVRRLVVYEESLVDTVLAIQFEVVASAVYSGLGDAWRFDGNGCPNVHWEPLLQGAGPTCPLLRGQGIPLVAAAFDYLPVYPLVMNGRIRFAEAFPTPVITNGARNTIAQLEFDQSAATTGPTTADSCGCLGRPVCFTLQNVYYTNARGLQVFIGTSSWNAEWNDPQGIHTLCGYVTAQYGQPFYPDTSCVAEVPTPAHPASWGSIKGMYRARAR